MNNIPANQPTVSKYNERIELLEQQLSARTMRAEEAHEAFEIVKKQHILALSDAVKYKQAAESAEQRIRESQEQEPVCEAGWAETIHRWFKPVAGGKMLYAAPIPPADVEELQRKIDRAHAAQRDAEQRELDCCHELDAEVEINEELTRKLAEQKELTELYKHDYAKSLCENDDLRTEVTRLSGECERLGRKLAEQQALFHVNMLRAWPEKSHDEIAAAIKSKGGAEELTKLIEEAKRQAVPEGWKLVPLVATLDMMDEGTQAIRDDGGDTTYHGANECYKAMLSAAPQPSPESAEERKD